MGAGSSKSLRHDSVVLCQMCSEKISERISVISKQLEDTSIPSGFGRIQQRAQLCIAKMDSVSF